MPSNSFSRTAIASAALGISQLVAKLTDFLLILILARLLTPEDFALIAIAMIVVQLTEAVFEVPIFQALVRLPRVTRDMLNTAFSISILRAGILLLIVTSIAPVAAWLFGEQRLLLLMPALAAGPAARGLMNPKLVLFARQMNFFPEAFITMFAKIATAIIAIPAAIFTESYWALVLITVLAPFLMLIASFAYVPYNPRYSLGSWRIFANMIGWSTVAQFFNAASWQANVFVFVNFSSRASTGNFSIADRLFSTLQNVLLAPIFRPSVSAMSDLARASSIKDRYVIAATAVFTLVAPVFTISSMLAEPAIHLLFGTGWSEAPKFFSVLSICAIISITGWLSQSVAFALDKTAYLAGSSFFGFLATAISTTFGFAFFGVVGFLYGQVIAACLSAGIRVWVVKRLIDVSIFGQVKSLFIPAVSCCAIAGFLSFLSPLINYGSYLTLLASTLALAAFSVFLFLTLNVCIWLILGKPNGFEKIVLNRVANKISRHKIINPEQ